MSDVGRLFVRAGELNRPRAALVLQGPTASAALVPLVGTLLCSVFGLRILDCLPLHVIGRVSTTAF